MRVLQRLFYSELTLSAWLQRKRLQNDPLHNAGRHTIPALSESTKHQHVASTYTLLVSCIMYCVILASCILQVCAHSYSGAAENVTVVPFVSLNAHILDYRVMGPALC